MGIEGWIVSPLTIEGVEGEYAKSEADETDDFDRFFHEVSSFVVGSDHRIA